MSTPRLPTAVLLSCALLLLASCGGGGQGLRLENDPILVTSTSIPAMLSGESMNHVIPVQGGCGGPYVIKVIKGTLPGGLTLDQPSHAIVGNLLEDGEFDFTLEVTDTACKPFSTTRASFHMSIGVGEIVVVDARRDGNSVLVPVGAEDYNPDHPALPKVVYNDYATIEMIVAGGKGPYEAVLFDHPDIPDDGPLPLGASIPPKSTSVTGAPVQVGPGGGPFKVTLKINDSVGGIGYFTFYWLVETPAIIFATESLRAGQAGVTYSDQIFVAEGVPPFAYELVEVGLPDDYTSDKSTNPALDPTTNVIYNPGAPPTVTPAGAMVKIDASVYPAPNDLGPAYNVSHQGAPSEGILMYEVTGSLSGIARRRGTFSINAHVNSTLVPNSFGQHAWGTVGYEIFQSPPIMHDPAYTLDPAFTTVKPYARIQESMKGEIYNPDLGPNGLQILATGGVPDDGFTDAPHASQRVVDPAETPGAYKWEIDWNPDGDFGAGPGLGVIPGMELTGLGVFRIIEIGGVPQVDDLVPQFDQTLEFSASDSALPSSLASSAAEKVSFGIGPDRILVTTSTTSMVSTTDNRSWDDSEMTLKYVLPQGVGFQMRAPLASDLTGEGSDKHLLPSEAGTVTPGALFTSVDLLRVSVNPTGYWDDRLYLNPNAARPWQNSQSAFYYYLYGPGCHGTTSYSSGTYTYAYQPSTSCVRLPTCKDGSVNPNKSLGVYTDGGKLHVFDTSTHFGIFIVRSDGRLYVPAAFQRSGSGYISFGDNWSYAYRTSTTTHSATRIPQMTVSPDGRIAAFKLRRDTSYSQYETAGTTPVLLISLTGERIAAWGDEVYKIVSTGSSGSSSTGYYMYASSLTLTNDHLYYIIGNQTTYAHFRDHYIYRYDLFGGATAGSFLHPSFNSEWTNTTNSPMQMPFQCYARTFCYNTSDGSPDPVMYGTHGYNSWEGALAPHPFRVNKEGNACAILAGLNTSATTVPTSDALFHHVWVDFEGSLHQLSTQRRHTSGGGRFGGITHGPCYTPVSGLWGDNNGPTSRFEISDDGLKVAVVYFRNQLVDPYLEYSASQDYYREDIAAYASTDSAWSGRTVYEVTGDSSTNTGNNTSYVSGKFPCSSTTYDHTWRFGALTFTTTGDGLVFWGGYPNYDPDCVIQTSNKYSCAKSFVGSIYSFDFEAGGVRNILAAADGGCNKTVGTAYTSYTFSPSDWQVDGGVIKPVAGFRSQDGNFMYLVTRGAVGSASDRMRDGSLIGVNVRSVNASGTSAINVNGHQDGRAFYVEFPSGMVYSSFLAGTYPYVAMGIGYTYSSVYQNYYSNIGYNSCVSAMDNGRVFFTSVTAPTTTYTQQSNTYGGPVLATYSAGYPYYMKKIFVFDANRGGDMQVVADAGWTGPSYQHVQGLVVSDDGTAMSVVDSTYSSTHYMEYENFNVFSNVQMNPATGAMIGTPTRQVFETQTCVGDCAAFSPKLDAVYFAGGAGSTGMSLKRGEIGGSSTGTSLGFPTARYAVLHAGR